MPIRIQRKRTKGWRMPSTAIYVGRPTFWGNPFKVGVDGDAADCVRLYKLCVFDQDQNPGDLTNKQLAVANKAWPDAFAIPDPMTVKLFLSGSDLVCWCPLDQPCHADVLLEVANQ